MPPQWIPAARRKSSREGKIHSLFFLPSLLLRVLWPMQRTGQWPVCGSRFWFQRWVGEVGLRETTQCVAQVSTVCLSWDRPPNKRTHPTEGLSSRATPPPPPRIHMTGRAMTRVFARVCLSHVESGLEPSPVTLFNLLSMYLHWISVFWTRPNPAQCKSMH